MGKKKALACNEIVTPEKIISGYLIINGPKIDAVTEKLPLGFNGEILDLSHKTIFPGFIDLHIHGAGGWQIGNSPEDVTNMARFLAYNGVTSFYPTLGTFKKEKILQTLIDLNEIMENQMSDITPNEETPLAELLGIHLEGPFLSKKEKGAMPEEYLLESSIEIMEEFEKAAPGKIARVTAAPEKKNALELIKYLDNKGYTVAGGHTDATYEQLKAGIDAGITVANHMYNAMRGLHHRKPGTVGAYLTDDRVSCEIISDFIHVHPAVIDLTLRAKGMDNVYIISDTIIAAGLPPGVYEFAGRKIKIDKNGISRLENGTIAGSTILMSKSFRNLMTELGLSKRETAQLTSANPARIAGVYDRKGSLEGGKDADLVIVNQDYEVEYSFVRGQKSNYPGRDKEEFIRRDLSEIK